MTTAWLQALLIFAAAAQEVNAFASLARTAPAVRSQLRTPTFLPYQIHDTKMAQAVEMNLEAFEVPSFTSLLLDPKTRVDDVQLSFLPDENGSLQKFPLVVTPKHDASLTFLTNFMKDNQQWLDKNLLKYGAILFRDFDVDTAHEVETAIQALEPNLSSTYRGTSPRSAQDGTTFVFSAAEVPSHFPIAQHLEMSFLPAVPRRVFFSALQAPKSIGGETALADFRQVYRDLPRKLRAKLATKKLRYTRTLHRQGAKWSSDVAARKSWSEVYETSDKSQVERLAEEEKMPVRWQGDSMVSQYESNAFERHPETGEMTWFNHAAVFHFTSFPAELWHAFTRTKEWRFFFHSVAVWAYSLVWYGLLRKRMALDVSFGDGTPIPVQEMHSIRRAIHKNMVLNRWEKGDIVMIDNLSTSHGRQPTYDSGRRIVVAWSDVVEKDNALQKQQ